MEKIKYCCGILFYNRIDWFDEAVESVVKSLEGHESKIFIINNGAPEEIAKQIKKKYSSYEFITIEENQGFDFGMKVAMEHMCKLNYDYICVFTDDIVLDNDCFNNLSNLISSSRETGVWGLMPYTVEDRGCLGFPPAAYIESWFTFKRTGLWENDLDSLGRNRRLDYLTGIMVFKSELVKRIGGFDKDLFMYFEEMDYSFRSRIAGFPIAVAKSAKIYYRLAEEVKTYGRKNRYFALRNEGNVFLKFSPYYSRLFFIPYFVIKMIIIALVTFIKGFLYKDFTNFKASIYALIDFILRKKGIGSFKKI